MARKTTKYFDSMRLREDRSDIEMDWIERVILNADTTVIQADSRIKKGGRIAESDGRFLRVILLQDGETLHNAFFDRRFKP